MPILLPPAGSFVADKVHVLAERHPEYCNKTGLGFWPIPSAFPLLLTHALHALQKEITGLYIRHSPHADYLAEVRMLFMELMHKGDLGENHTKLFLEDHPMVKDVDITPALADRLPFARFCREVLKVDDFLVLCGVICRNEIGSVEEARALLDTGIIADGRYAQVHLEEEIEHARASERILQILTEDYGAIYSKGFEFGMVLHDNLYAEAVS